MKARLLLALALLPLSALAQIQVFVFNGTSETPAGSFFNVGAATPGDTLETRFRVRNEGSGPAALQTLLLAGSGVSAGLSLCPFPALTIAPGNYAEFRVDFTPTSIATYSAFMTVNTTNITLQGNGVAAASLTLAGSQTPLAAGASIDFGPVTVGSSSLQSLTLSSTTSFTVQTITVSGTGFSGPIGRSAPVQLGPGQTASFQVQFKPSTAQPAQGTLTVDGRVFNLTGLGVSPALATTLPPITLNLASAVGASAQQNSLTVALGSASPIGGSGTLTMQFTPSVPGVADDPSVQFLSGKARVATVNFAQGSSVGTFNGQPSIAFSTGATAGTISFKLTLEDGTQGPLASLTIPPAAVTLDTATGLRKAGELDVGLTGLDNSYSASQLSFTFYDTAGATVQPGAIPVNVSSIFQQYFASTQVGGMFALLAKFPVAGDTSQIASVTVQATNAVGAITTQQIPIAGSTPPQVVPTSY